MYCFNIILWPVTSLTFLGIVGYKTTLCNMFFCRDRNLLSQQNVGLTENMLGTSGNVKL